MNVGVLVIADNHFIVRGPEPSAEQARRLARRWSLIEIGSAIVATEPFEQWQVSTKEFRENLSWAVIVAEPPSPAVAQLLAELAARGIPIRSFL